MLDIKFIREHPERIKEGARKKGINFDVNYLVELDERRRSKIKEVDDMRARQNEISDIVAMLKGGEKTQKIQESKEIKAHLGNTEFELKTLEEEFHDLMLRVPNVPDDSVPEGESDVDNLEIKRWGVIQNFDFTSQSHIDIMLGLDMVDFDRGAKVAGFRGYFLKNAGARLAWALWRYAEVFFLEKGFTPIVAPSLVRREAFLGTGYLPQGEEDLYRTQDDQYLTGTAEVAIMGYFMNEILAPGTLPQKILGFSPCFRREAGSYGKDIKGLIRVHEFYKWEQVILCEASHEESVRWHEWLHRNTEELIESLQIPYRTVVNCGADLGLGQVKKYDIELWVPGENKYREIGSTSYFHDFQTRRLNIRYKDAKGVSHFAHSLNSTALPTPRILVSIIENYQQKDGSVRVPEALQPYMGGMSIITKKKE